MTVARMGLKLKVVDQGQCLLRECTAVCCGRGWWPWRWVVVVAWSAAAWPGKACGVARSRGMAATLG